MALLFMKRTGLVVIAYELMAPDSLLNLVNDAKAVIYAEAQEFDRGAERSAMLKGCCGRCEN